MIQSVVLSKKAACDILQNVLDERMSCKVSKSLWFAFRPLLLADSSIERL